MIPQGALIEALYLRTQRTLITQEAISTIRGGVIKWDTQARDYMASRQVPMEEAAWLTISNPHKI